MPDNNALSPSELGILDCLFNGGRALSLKVCVALVWLCICFTAGLPVMQCQIEERKFKFLMDFFEISSIQSNECSLTGFVAVGRFLCDVSFTFEPSLSLLFELHMQLIPLNFNVARNHSFFHFRIVIFFGMHSIIITIIFR